MVKEKLAPGSLILWRDVEGIDDDRSIDIVLGESDESDDRDDYMILSNNGCLEYLDQSENFFHPDNQYQTEVISVRTHSYVCIKKVR